MTGRVKVEPTPGERLERLEKFAALLSPSTWKETEPHLFIPGDVVASKVPRHDGLRVTIESVHHVGDDEVFRCNAGDGDIHLFRVKELLLVTPAKETSP